MRFDIETQASPEQVHRALTNFTEERLHIWNRTLDPKTYELREHGSNWAVARESTPRSPFWVVARYDWTDPSVVRWTVVQSSYRGGGQGFRPDRPTRRRRQPGTRRVDQHQAPAAEAHAPSAAPRPGPDDRANVGRRAGPICTDPRHLSRTGTPARRDLPSRREPAQAPHGYAAIRAPSHVHRLLIVSSGTRSPGEPPSRRPECFASPTSAHLAYPTLHGNPYADT
jgi:hypothetical protein